MSSIGDEGVYKVAALLKQRKRKGKVEYLVRWKGWSDKHNSWEPEDNVLDQSLLQHFKEKQRDKNKGDRKRSSTGSGKGSAKKVPLKKKPKRTIEDSESEDSEEEEEEEDSNDDEEQEDEEHDVEKPSTSTPTPPTTTGRPRGRPRKYPKIEEKKPEKEEEKSVDVESTAVAQSVIESEKEVERKKTPIEPEKEIEARTAQDERRSPSPVIEEVAIAKENEESPPGPSKPREIVERRPVEKEKLRDDILEKPTESQQARRTQIPKDLEKDVDRPRVLTPGQAIVGQMTAIPNAVAGMPSKIFLVGPASQASERMQQLQVCDHSNLDEKASIEKIKNDLKNETKHFTIAWRDVKRPQEVFQYHPTMRVTEVHCDGHTTCIMDI